MLYTFVLDWLTIEKVNMYDDDKTKLGEADGEFVVARLTDGFIYREGEEYGHKIKFIVVDGKVVIQDTTAYSMTSGSAIKGIEPDYDYVKFVKVLPVRTKATVKDKREGFFIPAPNAEENAKAKARFFGTRESNIWSAFDSQKYWEAAYEANMRRAMDGDDYSILGNPDVLNEPTNDTPQ